MHRQQLELSLMTCYCRDTGGKEDALVMVKCCLMSSDVSWHIRDKFVTNAEARFSKSLRPRKPEGSLGRTAQDVHLDSHTQLLNYGDARLLACLLSCCLTSTEAGWPIRDGDRVGRGDRVIGSTAGNRPKKTGETVDRRQNNGSVKGGVPSPLPSDLCTVQLLFSTAVLDRVTKTMSVAPLLMNNLDNSKQKTFQLAQPSSNLPTHDLFWAKSEGPSSTSLL